ncbi:MAG: hypothetical protein EAX89_03165 [Candidatus Lokiarchaeota archaeon]|nr:hypothetical protein [Candidatus Lokiarchaeota archaeon]
MAWGGSLNKKGSDHIRKVRDADNVIKFLEDMKKQVGENQKKIIIKTINIIVDYFNNSYKSKKEL